MTFYDTLSLNRHYRFSYCFIVDCIEHLDQIKYNATQRNEINDVIAKARFLGANIKSASYTSICLHECSWCCLIRIRPMFCMAVRKMKTPRGKVEHRAKNRIQTFSVFVLVHMNKCSCKDNLILFLEPKIWSVVGYKFWFTLFHLHTYFILMHFIFIKCIPKR